MNRRERRAQQAQGRSNSGKPHPTMSFTELVGQESLNRLKPFIAEQVQVMGAQIARQQLSAMADTLTRLSVLEVLAKEKLGETDDSLAERVADREDEATGYVTSSEPVAKGNKVRISFRGHEEGKEPSMDENDFTRAVIRRVATEPYQFPPTVEDGVLGLKVGESKSVTVETGSTTNAKGEQTKNPSMVFEVRVDRVSVPKPKPAPTPAPEVTAEAAPADAAPAAEAPTAEGTNAPT